MAKLGIQTIIFGERNGSDLPGVLKDIKAAGYDGAEIGMGDAMPDTVRRLFSDAGLECCGYHAGFGTFEDIAELEKHAIHLAAVGGKYMMCSGTKGRDRAGFTESGRILNQAGSLLQNHGITLCYHNHNWEFFELDGGGTGMDVLLAETDENLVKLCVDVYWVACGGLDPSAFIIRNADRAVYFHFKDGTYNTATQQPITFTELGRGDVPLRGAVVAALAQHPEWIVTEQDRTDGDPVESAQISADFAHKELGI